MIERIFHSVVMTDVTGVNLGNLWQTNMYGDGVQITGL